MMAAKVLCRSLELEPLHGLVSIERPYPGHKLISFWCGFDNKNLAFRKLAYI